MGEGSKVSPRDRLRALSTEQQSQLLDPAELEFSRHGYSKASLNRILASAGMSKGQAYYYISDKADLYGAVIERALARLVERIGLAWQTPLAAEDFWRQVGVFFDRLAAVFKEDETLAALARGLYEGPTSQGASSGLMRMIRQKLEELLCEGQNAGAIRKDMPRSLIAAALFGAAREIDFWFATHWDELSLSEALELNSKTIGMIRAMAAEPELPVLQS
ncbi:MAG: TetR/AcrR family transcriptional regulator [Rhodobacteraceae bacterium]|nr:TetR/AcrR family transcriptional regulator [Paracoccaceae bacterium]